MTPEELHLLEKRKAGFEEFYKELFPVLVDFVGKLGIKPSHEVLKHAPQFVPYLELALQNMAVTDEADRIWLLARMGYFVGEYFSQKYRGCWFVNEVAGSRYFGRYVVGRFARLGNQALMLDPFQVAQTYVDTPMPRSLGNLLVEVEGELSQASDIPAT
jgi:hypothetical protein